jgi:hypothetical protein
MKLITLDDHALNKTSLKDAKYIEIYIFKATMLFCIFSNVQWNSFRTD